MRRRRNGKARGIIIGIALLLIAVGTGAYLASRGSYERPPVDEAMQPIDDVRPEAHPRVNIYVLKVTEDEVYLAPEIVKIKPGEDMHKAAMEELLDTNRWEGESKNLIPRGTKLLSLAVEDGLAVVNLSREFVDNFNGGARLEALTIHCVVHTLTQFEDVDSVQILVEGEVLGSLGGHLDTSEPISGDHTLLEGDN